MAPKVTIGIPVYNGEKWLADTAESVLTQTFADLCLIISDNASTDRTQEIAERLAATDSRVQYHRNASNVGVFRNFDILFDLCVSPYFKWCSVGDRMHTSFLERAVDVLDNDTDVSLVYARTQLIGDLAHRPDIQEVELALDSADPVSRYKDYFSRARLNSPFHGLIRARALSKTGLNAPFRGSDECLVAALLLHGRFFKISDELLLRRVEKSTATAVKTREELDEFFSIDAQKIGRFPNWRFQKQKFVDLLSAPISLGKKLSLLVYLIRGVNWQRRALLSDISAAVKRVLGLGRGRQSAVRGK